MWISRGGPDHIRLKDLLDPSMSECRSVLLPSLVSFIQFALEGRVALFVRPFFFSANLIALHKPGGGICPIAVGCTLRRLIAKIAGVLVRSDIVELLSPSQLGFGVPGGAEAAIHSARIYLENLDHQSSVVKLDFRNAFNSIRRDKMLSAVSLYCPCLFHYVYSSYSSSSHLFWYDRLLSSCEGVQQGDPLGPLLFCLTIHELVSQLKSEFTLFYLDDGTVGGDQESVESDLLLISEKCGELGLVLNSSKSEIICSNPSQSFPCIPTAPVIPPSQATLLGSSIGDVSSVDSLLMDKISLLKRLGDRLHLLSSHDALVLLRYSFALPKLMYSLRSCPCFMSSALESYDHLLRSIVSDITNCCLDNSAWTQCSLPVSLGGLGIRSALHLAPIAYLASTAASVDLVSLLVPPNIFSHSFIFRSDALSLWSAGHDIPLPSDESKQKSWDMVTASSVADSQRIWCLAECIPKFFSRASYG